MEGACKLPVLDSIALKAGAEFQNVIVDPEPLSDIILLEDGVAEEGEGFE